MSLLKMDDEKFSLNRARCMFYTLYALMFAFMIGDAFNIFLYLRRSFVELQFELPAAFTHIKIILESARLILPIFLGIALMILLSFFAADENVPEK